MPTTGALTDYAENKLLEHLMGKAQMTYPTTTQLALCTGAPDDTYDTDISDIEVISGRGYSRQTITWGSASSGEISNSALIEFGDALDDWGTVTHVVVLATISGTPHVVCWGELTTPYAIYTDDILRFRVGDLVVSLD